MNDPKPLPEQLTALQEVAAQMHELWVPFIQAGWTGEQALYLVAATMGGPLLPPKGEPLS